MFQGSRDIDPNFEPDEILYRRFCPTEVLGDRLAPDSIKFPDWSVNRQKYSEPEDLQYPSKLDQIYACCGVAGFLVSDIPPKLEAFTFEVKHQPESDNYAHSELLTYKNGVCGNEIKNFKVSNTIKKTFRIALSERIKIIVEFSTNSSCLSIK
jgi:hypothetical protein